MQCVGRSKPDEQENSDETEAPTKHGGGELCKV